ncbi:PROTEIN JAGUNAL-like protein 1 [Salix purpurea]|uniref:PROTEIN JAGUNAL-like protein 1 n=1 Tax=Salix purpurea TaxID=77065 RepID=A0A9Q0ZV56_SALPP|nr:PROTEIN JAGUNAL-like protein 1 [Salix purpurea]
MQQRKAGRPSGTDGSDFSYRMVVDSRYTKVAKGKSRLKALIFIQGIFQLIVLFYVALPISKGKDPNILAVSSSVIGLISLLIGELGRRRSRGGFLKFYLAMSTITVLLSISCAASSSSTLEFIQNPTEWETKKFELIETLVLLLGRLHIPHALYAQFSDTTFSIFQIYLLLSEQDCWCRCSRSAL